jgi:hypothetical protein
MKAIRLLHALLCLVSIAAAAALPSGTEVQMRLKTKISSTSMPDEKIEAVVIAPVVSGGQIVIPAGSLVTGRVKSASPAKPDERAVIAPEFLALDVPGVGHMPLAAKLVDVDNARETVDQDGKIVGILESETLTARMDRGLEKLSERYSRFADVLQIAKDAILKKADTEITYAPGVEMTAALTQPLKIEGEVTPAKLEIISPFNELYDLVNAQPFQTVAEKPPKPSDLTNLMFLGARERLDATFHAAGWNTAEELNAMSGLETFRAIVEQRGYKEAPMSTLVLDGRAPDLVFQKQNNTFAERHHLRIWKRPGTFQGHDIWVCAATHDIGISFSAENRTFIHDIDPQIDRERAKVVSDFVFTGDVKALALVERPAVPTSTENATGDKVETDGKMAVLLLE